MVGRVILSHLLSGARFQRYYKMATTGWRTARVATFLSFFCQRQRTNSAESKN